MQNEFDHFSASRQTMNTHQAQARIDLTRLPWLKPILTSRWPLFLARTITLALFVFTLLAGLFGSRVGNHNFAIIFLWITWWTALKLVFIPFGGRSWCSVCPIPMPGEWLQQGGFLNGYAARFGLGRRWPKSLRGYWPQAAGFMAVGLFSALTLTDPRTTAWVLLGLFGLAIGMSLVFERRAFCNHICPIGGLTGIYAKTAPLEVHVLDSSVCKEHGDKSCYHACPWGIYPVAMRDASACGLCLECVRACPRDNLALNLRPFGNDLNRPLPQNRLDETFMALVMLASAIAFSAVFIGGWGWLKSAAFHIFSIEWFLYAAGFLFLCLFVVPGAYTLAAWVSQRYSSRAANLKFTAARFSPALLPLGLFTWIAFTISFALPKLNTVLSVLSDPLGWGWDLFGTASSTLALDLSGISQVTQIAILAFGYFWALRTALRLANGAPKQAMPIGIFMAGYSLVMLWLMIG